MCWMLLRWSGRVLLLEVKRLASRVWAAVAAGVKWVTLLLLPFFAAAFSGALWWLSGGACGAGAIFRDAAGAQEGLFLFTERVALMVLYDVLLR